MPSVIFTYLNQGLDAIGKMLSFSIIVHADRMTVDGAGEVMTCAVVIAAKGPIRNLKGNVGTGSIVIETWQRAGEVTTAFMIVYMPTWVSLIEPLMLTCLDRE